MDTKFQTSFIPKKPITIQEVKTRGSLSIFVLVAVILFLISAGGAVGVILWKQQLLADQEALKANLEERKKQFDFELVDKLKRKNTKIDIAKKLLDNHLSSSDIFSIIENVTVVNVRYKNFDFKAPEQKTENASIKMTGEAKDYPTIAYQSDVLAKYPYIKNGTLSGITLQKNGFVSFEFSGAISPSDVLYKKAFQQAPASAPSTPTSPITPSGAPVAPSSTESQTNTEVQNTNTTAPVKQPAQVKPSIVPR